MVEHSSEDPFGSIPISGEGAEEKRSAGTPPPAEIPPLLPRRRRKRKKSASLFLKLLVLMPFILGPVYLLAGYFLLPYYCHAVLPAELARSLERPVTIGSAEFNPFTLTLTLYNGIVGPRFSDPHDKVDPLLSFSRFRINLEAFSIFRHGIISSETGIDHPFLHIVKHKDRTYNIVQAFSSITAPPAGKDGKKSQALFFSLNNITLTNGRLLYDDQAAGKTHTIEELSLTLPVLSNFPADKRNQFIYGAGRIQPGLRAKINGSPIKLNGQSRMTPEGLEASLSLHLKELDLADYFAYLPLDCNFTVGRGRAVFDLNIIVSSALTGDTSLKIRGAGRLTDVWLYDPEGKELAKIPSIKISGDVSPLRGRYHFQEINLSAPEVHIERRPQRSWVFPAFNAPATSAGKRRPMDVRVDRLTADGGKIFFVDRLVPGGFADTWSEINLTITSLSTDPGKTADFALAGRNEGKAGISCQGKILTLPLRIEGLALINRLELPAFRPYFPQEGAMRLNSGLAVRIESHFRIRPGGKDKKNNLSLSDTAIDVKDVILTAMDREWFKVPELTIRQAGLDINGRSLNLGSINADKGYMLFAWNRAGELNWTESGLKNVGEKGRGEKWAVDLESLDLGGMDVDLEKTSDAGIISLRLKDAALRTTRLANHDDGKGNLFASAVFNKDGMLRLSGALSPAPFKAGLDLELDNLPIELLRPLIKNWPGPEISGGLLNADGRINLPELSFAGKAGINDFTARSSDGKEIFKTREASGLGLALSLNPFSLKADMITLREPRVNWTISKNGESILKFPDHIRLPVKSLLDIRTIALNDGKIDFHDNYISPPFTASVAGISGRITGIRGQAGNRAAYAINGVFQQKAPLEIKGTIGIFDQQPYADLDIKAASLDVSSLFPYLEPQIGYKLTGGRFDLTGDYHLEEQKTSGRYRISVNGLTLGKRLNGNSYLPLTIALLTDPDDHLLLEFPLKSETASPFASLRAGFTRNLRDLLLKTAVSPALLLAPLSKSQTPPGALTFPYGKDKPDDQGRERLAELAGILGQRPRLMLKVKGLADGKGDRDAILRQKAEELESRRAARDALLSRELTSSYGNEEIPAVQNTSPAGASLSEAPAEVKDDELSALARRRAQTVCRLLAESGIDKSRLSTGDDVKLIPAGGPGPAGNRVDFLFKTRQADSNLNP